MSLAFVYEMITKYMGQEISMIRLNYLRTKTTRYFVFFIN